MLKKVYNKFKFNINKMDCIKWSDAFSVGVKIIDSQHMHLVGIMNKLCNALDKGQEMKVIKNVLDELSEYAVVHFDTEEKF